LHLQVWLWPREGLQLLRYGSAPTEPLHRDAASVRRVRVRLQVLRLQQLMHVLLMPQQLCD